MSQYTPRAAGLSGDHGWDDSDAQDRPSGALTTALLVITASTCWASLWLSAGFPPLAFLVSRKQRSERA